MARGARFIQCRYLPGSRRLITRHVQAIALTTLPSLSANQIRPAPTGMGSWSILFQASSAEALSNSFQKLMTSPRQYRRSYIMAQQSPF